MMAARGYSSSSETSSDGSATPRKAFSYNHDYVVQHASDYYAPAATVNPLRVGLLQRDEEDQQRAYGQRPDTPEKSLWHLPTPTILKYLLVAVLFLTAALGFLLAAATARGPLQPHGPPGGRAKDTLVVYIFADTDPEYAHNMQHFIQHAVREDDRCDYVFIIQVGWAGLGWRGWRGWLLAGCERRAWLADGLATCSQPADSRPPAAGRRPLPRSTTRRCRPTTCRCCRQTRATCSTRTPATTGARRAGCSRAARWVAGWPGLPASRRRRRANRCTLGGPPVPA